MFTLFVLAIGYLPITDEPKDDGVKNEAEKLFQKMEEKLEKAKTLECAFDGYIPSDFGSFEGALVLAEGNKAWIHIRKAKNDGLQLQVDNEAARLGLQAVSDGDHLFIHGRPFGFPRPERRATPKNLNANIITWISRTGLIMANIPLPVQKVDGGKLEQKPDSVKDAFRLSSFKLGNKEKVGERDTQKLEYQLSVKGNEDHIHAAVVVWLDIKTMLPVKRTLTDPMAEPKEPLTENYTKLIINEKVDSKRFELPK